MTQVHAPLARLPRQTKPSYYRDGIVGHDYTARRNHIYNVNDGMGAFSQPSGDGDCNAFIYGNCVHDLVFWKNDPAHTDGTHNDCLQLRGGAHIRVKGNHFVGSSINAPGSENSANPELYPGNPRYPYLNGQCVILNQNTHQLSDVQVDENRFKGGSAQLSLNRGTKYATLRVDSARNNHFDEDIFTFGSITPDRRWVALTGRGPATAPYITAPGLYETSRFTGSGTLLTEGRATGIRIVSE